MIYIIWKYNQIMFDITHYLKIDKLSLYFLGNEITWYTKLKEKGNRK